MAGSGEDWASDEDYPHARRGLLFRLSASSRPEQRVDVVESIVHNLRAILNSDRGISPSSPELGLGLHGALTEWESNRPAVLAEIAKLIERFEPRLTDVEVDDMGHAGPHRFSVLISATLRDGRAFRARTDMAASGAADVQQVLTEI